MGKFGAMNGNGERLFDFFSANRLIKTGIIVPQDIHKLTWRSPHGRTINQIDHAVVNGNIYYYIRHYIRHQSNERTRSVQPERTYIVKTRIRLKFARTEGRMNVRERLDLSKLQ